MAKFERGAHICDCSLCSQTNMAKWKCDVCGYIHIGDEPPAICPICGADKSHFHEIKEDDKN